MLSKLRRGGRLKLLLLLLVVAIGAIASIAYLASQSGAQTPKLPAGCARAQGGFLIIASNTGWNDSEGHGAPETPWPIIQVQQGTTVNITLCSVSNYTHSFMITHYITDPTEYTISYGQVENISFTATNAGTFLIQCGLPCPIHIYMQNGEFIVNANA